MNTLNLTDRTSISTTATYISPNTVTDWPNSMWIKPDYISPYTSPASPLFPNTILSSTTLNSNNMNKLQQHQVAVFKITRNEDNEIISAKFLKEMWIETKDTSVEFEVARDKDLSKYEASDLSIKIIHTFTF